MGSHGRQQMHSIEPPVSSDTHKHGTAAVVVGLCAHGLAVARALHRSGVRNIHAVEADRSLPGAKTRFARVHQVGDMQGPGLVQALKAIRPQIDSMEAPPLFLMNDDMVRRVAQCWEELSDMYRLSWAACRERIERYLDKSVLHSHCQEVGLSYPQAEVLRSEADLTAFAERFHSPFIVKPTRPLSGFKAKCLSSFAELRALLAQHRQDLPYLVQQWIPGDDRQIVICGFYFDRGRVLAEFAGQKLRSSPPTLGRGTAARSYHDRSVLALARRFFAPLALSGPASLEFKRDPQGNYWVIEPTMGRTNFWLDCCVINGINLPYLEYCHQTGHDLPVFEQRADSVWLDTERDPVALPWYLLNRHRLQSKGERLVFPYLHREDPMPFVWATQRSVRQWSMRAVRKLRRIITQ